MVADAKGRVVYAKAALISRDSGVVRALDRVATGTPVASVTHRGVRYLETTAKRNGVPGRADPRIRDLLAVQLSGIAASRASRPID